MSFRAHDGMVESPVWPETGSKCTPVNIPQLALSRGRATAVPDLPAEKETRKFSISASKNGWVSDFAFGRKGNPKVPSFGPQEWMGA